MMLEIYIWNIILTLAQLSEIIFRWESEKELKSRRFCMWILARIQVNDLIASQTEFI